MGGTQSSAKAGATTHISRRMWVAGVGSDSPAVHGSQPFFQAGVTASLTLLDHSLLHASFDRVHENRQPLFCASTLAVGACGRDGPGGTSEYRAMPSPLIKRPLHARSPGPQVTFRLHATLPLRWDVLTR